MAMSVAASMPPITVGAEDAGATSAPAPVAITSGTQPRMKAKAVIRIGRRRSRAPRQRRVDERLALLVLVLGELDDQDGVLGRQADQHDQADLRVDVVLEARAARARRRRRTRRSGVPSSTLKGSVQLSYCAARMQEHHEQREAEDDRRRDALRGHLLLERHARCSRSPSRAAWSARRPPRAPSWPARSCSRARAMPLICAARYSL